MPSRLLQPAKRGASDERLTPNQRLFVQALLADPMYNPTNAAIAAGYKSAPQMANKLMKNPVIQAIVGKEIAKRAEKFEIKADEVLQELHHLAMARSEECFDEDGKLLPIKDMSERARAAIKSFKVTEKIVAGGKKGEQVTIRVTDVELHDKRGSLDMLFKHLGLYEKDNNQKPAAVFDLSQLYARPVVKDPVREAIEASSIVVEEPKKVTHDIDEFEGEETDG